MAMAWFRLDLVAVIPAVTAWCFRSIVPDPATAAAERMDLVTAPPVETAWQLSLVEAKLLTLECRLDIVTEAVGLTACNRMMVGPTAIGFAMSVTLVSSAAGLSCVCTAASVVDGTEELLSLSLLIGIDTVPMAVLAMFAVTADEAALETTAVGKAAFSGPTALVAAALAASDILLQFS